jgi:hypothetical protein
VAAAGTATSIGGIALGITFLILPLVLTLSALSYYCIERRSCGCAAAM